MRLSLLSFVACAGIAGQVSAQNITLFGQEYTTVRLNYSEGVQLPNVAFPSDPPVPFIESEGVIWVGGNRLLMSADDISDAGFGMPDNWIVEIQLAEVNGQITAIQSFRTILMQDVGMVGYDLNPSGITVNTGAGHAGGGNIVGLNGDGVLYGFSYQPGTEGVQLEFPPGSGCLATPGTCAMNISARNTNAEDVAYAPVRGGEFFVTNQDGEQVERWNALTGEFIASFAVGGAVPGGPVGSTTKGLAYLADSPALPASIRRPDGVVLVAFDDDFPALQAFDTLGNHIATEVLTADGTPGGTSRLDITGCPSALSIESLTADVSTGRLFLSNQGSLTQCNYLWVLSPVAVPPACDPDVNCDGSPDQGDVACMILAVAGDVSCICQDPDFNQDGSADQGDVAAIIGVVAGQPCP